MHHKCIISLRFLLCLAALWLAAPLVGFEPADGPALEAKAFATGLGLDARGNIVLGLALGDVIPGDVGNRTGMVGLVPGGGLFVRTKDDGARVVPGYQACALSELRGHEILDGSTGIVLALVEGGVALVDFVHSKTHVISHAAAVAVASADFDLDDDEEVALALKSGGVLLLDEELETAYAVTEATASRLAAGDFLRRGYEQLAVGLPGGGLEVLDLVEEESVAAEAPAFRSMIAVDLDGDDDDEVLGLTPRGDLVAVDIERREIFWVALEDFEVTIGDGFATLLLGPPSELTFVRGDANVDDVVDLSDGVAILGNLFLGNRAPAPCHDALDADDSGGLEITDAVYVFGFLFRGGPRMPEPYPDFGFDPTPDGLPCSP